MKVFSEDLFGVAGGLTDAHGWSFWRMSPLRVCGKEKEDGERDIYRGG